MDRRRKLEFKVAEEDAGVRLDIYLTERNVAQSRSHVKKLIDEGKIQVNGKSTKAGYKVKAGDDIEATIPPPRRLTVEPELIPLDILYEDKDLIVVNKPAGMVVHPAPGNYTGTLVNALLAHCTDLSGIGGVIRPGIVHRLDKDTSGVIVAAKNDTTHIQLSAQIRNRTAHRRYLALVHGNVKQDEGWVEAPIGRHPVHRKRMAVVADGRPARTRYIVRERFGDYTLIECRLDTGRTHQIRVHMAFIKHPVVGDPKYGPRRAHLGLNRQALHAYYLSFIHPCSGERLEITAPLAQDMQQVIERLRQKSL